MTFQKNISTIDYILGDKNVKQARADLEKDIKKKQEMFEIEKNRDEAKKQRDKQIEQMKQKNMDKYKY